MCCCERRGFQAFQTGIGYRNLKVLGPMNHESDLTNLFSTFAKSRLKSVIFFLDDMNDFVPRLII